LASFSLEVLIVGGETRRLDVASRSAEVVAAEFIVVGVVEE
jgi:hypothetical protein